ncbi:MAG: hypothetical protein ACYCUF_11855, partial [Acidimicrobiales bacterium]
MRSSEIRGIALTDEEVIALGCRSGIPWPSPAPTVDVTNLDEVRCSATRGARSLLVRGLLGQDGNDTLNPELEELVRPVLHGNLSVGTYMVGSAYAYSADGPATAGYSNGSDICTAEIISPAGIHYLQEEPYAGCLDAARDFLEYCFTCGLE